jgi:ribonuclease Z
MDLDVVFLGTAGSMPTADRSATALLVRRGGERLLFDCAEGTQRQLLRSSLGLIDLREVFLTHYHADHYLGLPGMLKTFALRGRDVPIAIYGPPGLEQLFTSLRRIFGKLTYDYDLVELRPGDMLERDGYRLQTFPVQHGVSSIGYALVEDDRPGRFDVETAGKGARRRAARADDRDRRRYGADAQRPGGCGRRRPARPRGDVPRRGAGTR